MVLLDIIDIIYIYSVDQLALTHIPAELVGRGNIPMKVKVDGDGLSGCPCYELLTDFTAGF